MISGMVLRFLADGRSAMTRLRQARWFVLALGLSYCIGLWVALTTTAVASQYGLRSAPGVRRSSQLRRVHVMRAPTGHFVVAPVLSYPELEQLQRVQNGVQIEGYSPDVAMIGLGDAKHRTSVALISQDFLRMLGVGLQDGRFPSAEDAQSGRSPAVIISDRFWLRHFARSRSAVGSVIHVNAQPVRVIGILSPTFGGLDRTLIDVWLPVRNAPILSEPRRLSETSYYLSAVGRITSPDEVTSIERRLVRALSDRSILDASITDIRLRPFTADRIGREGAGRQSALLALVLAGGVLVLSLANCILLMLGRIQYRLPELCTRCVVGAPPGAIVASIALEIGLVMAAFSAPGLVAVAKARQLLRLGEQTDAPHLVDSFLIAIAVVIAAGSLLLVFSGSTLGLHRRLQWPLRLNHSTKATRGLRQFLIGSYAAAVTALAVGCLPIWLAHVRLKGVRPGFDPANAIATTVIVGQVPDHGQALAVGATMERLQGLPFAFAVGSSDGLPYRTSTVRPIACLPDRQAAFPAHVYSLRGNFLDALGVPILLGDASRLSDERPGAFMVVNRTLAKQCWPDAPIGECVFANGVQCVTVLAVAGDVDAIGLGETARPTVYVPSARFPDAETLHFVVRTTTQPSAEMVRSVDRIIGDEFPSATTKTELVRDIVYEQSAFLRLMARLAMLLLLIAAMLGLLGLRASVQYSVRHRRHELGVRAAIGASPTTLMRSASADLLVASLVGAFVGTWVGIVAARVIGSVLPGVQTSLASQLVLGGLVPLLLLLFSARPIWITSREQPKALLGARV